MEEIIEIFICRHGFVPWGAPGEHVDKNNTEGPDVPEASGVYIGVTLLPYTFCK